MAEIHIERKKSVWPLALGLIVLLLIWGVVAVMWERREATPAEPPAPTATAATQTAAAAPEAGTMAREAPRDAAPPPTDESPPRQ